MNKVTRVIIFILAFPILAVYLFMTWPYYVGLALDNRLEITGDWIKILSNYLGPHRYFGWTVVGAIGTATWCIGLLCILPVWLVLSVG
jgi:hypothetical protein